MKKHALLGLALWFTAAAAAAQVSAGRMGVTNTEMS